MPDLSSSPDGLDIAFIEPADVHYYQPGWTMVGAGVFRSEVTARAMAKVMPSAAKWIKAAVVGFQPASNTVFLDDGRAVRYEKLVVAPGLKLDWDEVEGLVEALGRNGVTPNYRYDLVQKSRGGTALFTQPPMPIKCACAPQKAMYLSCDAWTRAGTQRSTKVEFLNAGPALFGVTPYVPPLMKYVERYGIELSFGHDLVKVDGPARKAWFKRSLPDGGMRDILSVGCGIEDDLVPANGCAERHCSADAIDRRLRHRLRPWIAVVHMRGHRPRAGRFWLPREFLRLQISPPGRGPRTTRFAHYRE
jgi:sulfide:quinone oxidoreductase